MPDKDDQKPQDWGEKPVSHSSKKKIPTRKTAISLKDGTAEGKIPHITAAGRGKIAEKILQLAFENDIKVREDSDLANMLVQFELDSPIPSEAFMAVAEVLSYVYKANGKPNPFDSAAKNRNTLNDER